MKKTFVSTIAALAMMSTAAAHAQKWAGGDISLLPLCEQAGAAYRDMDGMPVEDYLKWCHDQGMNSMRVRLFVDPDLYREKHSSDTDASTRYDPNACQSLEYILPLCKRIVDEGMALMLDFHYSDTWADPAAQWVPAAWANLNDGQLTDRIYEYTRDCLLTLKANGITPSFIQTGNEISYGMLWGPVGTRTPQKALMGKEDGWERLCNLLSAAAKACRETCPDAKIILHTERAGNIPVLENFYTRMRQAQVDYDIIGLSYYPYFHGDMWLLKKALESTAANFPDKRVMVVETGYPYAWEVPGSIYDYTEKWPYSEDGQATFAHDLTDLLKSFPQVDGLYWWWMEYNAFSTDLSGWYNAPLTDSRNGRVTAAFPIIASFASDDAAVETIPTDTPSEETHQWYTPAGIPRRQTPGNGALVKGNIVIRP